MSKDFDSWNIQKKKTDGFIKRTFFKESEVWWCSLGVNIGDEENGKGDNFTRPVLVFKKFNHNIFLGIPLSTQLKEDKYYYRFHFKGRMQSLLLSQIRLIDAKRLLNKLGELPEPELIGIKEKFRQLIF